MSGFGTSYGKWADAQAAVSEFEAVIFRDGHALTAGELARLRALRFEADLRLRELVGEIDSEAGLLFPPTHGRNDPPEEARSPSQA